MDNASVVTNGERATTPGTAAMQGTLAGSALGVGAVLGLLAGTEVPSLAGWRVAISIGGGTILLYAALGWLVGLLLTVFHVERRLARLGRLARPGIMTVVILLIAELGWGVASGRNAGEYAPWHWAAVAVTALAISAALIALGSRVRLAGRRGLGLVTLLGLAGAIAGLLVFELPAGLYVVAFGLVAVVPSAAVASMRQRPDAPSVGSPGLSMVPALGIVAVVTGAAFFVWPAAGASRPPVVIISIDAWRADHCGVYSESDLTPNVDRFAQDAIVFEHAYAAAPWTFASLATMHTLKYPSQCGVGRRLRGSPPEFERMRLPQDQTTLAEIMRRAGYNTAFVGANPWLTRDYGVTQGFAYSYETGEGAMVETCGPHFRPALATCVGAALSQVWHASRPLVGKAQPIRKWASASHILTREAARFLEDNRGPTFLWVHYLDPHDPYLPEAPWPGEPTGWRRRHLGDPPQPVTSVGTWVQIINNELCLTDADKELMKQLYDGEVAQADRYAGELLDYLRDAGIYDEALIIVTADHGEEHWDHGGYQHGHTLHDEVLRVPLIVKLPYNRGAGMRVEAPVSLLDIGPTIAQITGVRWRGKAEGESVLDLVEPGRSATEERRLYAEGLSRGAEQRSVISWPYKLIWTPDHERWEMYDLSVDAEERNSPAAGGEAAVASLRESLESWSRAPAAFDSSARSRPIAMDEATRERLRALGYVEQ